MKNAMVVLLCGVLVSAASLSARQSNPQEEKAVWAVLESGTGAFVKKDHATIGKVFHSDLTYGHSSGRMQTKDEVVKDVANPQRVWLSYKLSDPHVRIYGNTAVVNCVADIMNGAPGKEDLSHSRYLWVLVKGAQGWQVVAGQRVAVDVKTKTVFDGKS